MPKELSPAGPCRWVAAGDLFWGRRPTPQTPFVGDKELAVVSPWVGSLGAQGSTRGTGFRIWEKAPRQALPLCCGLVAAHTDRMAEPSA